jgi:hypothetical protein
MLVKKLEHFLKPGITASIRIININKIEGAKIYENSID